MSEFKTYHPIVNITYFAAVIGFSMIFMHPLCLAISLVCGFCYSVMLNGKKAVKFNLMYILPLMIVSALLNPAFNHEGMTILTYLPSGNPLTAESILYGMAAACMIASVICHFSCFNKIITADKLMYLFGKILPAASLIISMTLRFVPKFSERIHIVRNAQKGIGEDVSDGNIIKRAKSGIKILSIMITWSLESSVETADSMKSRGFGLPKRTAFSNFRFDKRDFITLLWILILSAYIIIGGIFHGLSFDYFPIIQSGIYGFFGISLIFAYFLLFMCPIIIELAEEYRWKKLRLKI